MEHPPHRHRISRRRLLRAAVAIAVAGGAPARAADAWPSRPVRIVVPFTPGGSTDILGRAIAQKLQEALGQPFVVENRPGAGGSIGATEVARAAPDGYTLLMGHIGTLAVNPSLYPNLAYDPRTSFVPVALVARVPNVLVVHPAVPAKNVQELIALAKAKPGSLRYASGGNGSAAHIAMEYFKLRTQTDIGHIPYKGTSPAVTDVMGGQVELIMTGVPAVLQQVKAGKLRALAVSSARPVDSLPDVPTIAAATGMADFEAIQWYGIVAPARTPPAVVTLLNAEINRALATPALKTRLDSEGAEAAPMTPDAFGAMIAAEIARWKPVIEKAQMKPE
ncbi:MAG: tripartite tricarboxylate transporter substrate binding protein [Burkholderiales bacterium]